MPEPPTVEYRALTQTVLEQDPEQGNRWPLMPEVFQDMDYRPLTGSWADIVAREEQEQAAAAAAAMSTIVMPSNLPSFVQPTTASTPMLTATSAMLPATAKPLFSVVAMTSSRPSTSIGTALQTPIPIPVAQAAVDTPDVPSAVTIAIGGGSTEPPSSTPASQMDRRPVLRLADVAYAVRVSRVGQADHIVDTLLNSST